MNEIPNANPISILIVDDYQPLRTLLGRLLSHYRDLKVAGVASTGEEALALSIEHRPTVVVMDAAMPGMGGVEATRRLVSALPGVRVIGHSSTEEESVMRSAGAVDFVRKGSPPGVLLQAIRGAIPKE